MSIVIVVEFVSMWNTRSCKCFSYSLREIYENKDVYDVFVFFNYQAWCSMIKCVVALPGYVTKITDTNLLCDLACFFKNDFTLVNCLCIKDAYAWYDEHEPTSTIDASWLLKQLLLGYSDLLS